MNPKAEEVLLIVILQLIVIISSARLFGMLFRRMGQSQVCGEIAAGVSLTGGGSRVASLGARGVSRADTPRRGLCHLLRTGGTSLWAAVERARQ